MRIRLAAWKMRRGRLKGADLRNDPTPPVRYASKALIYESELRLISRWVMDYPRLETGGDLFGFWTHSGYPVIQYVIGPGSKARRTVTSFYQDRDYLIGAGAVLRNKHALQHIGEWHSHHTLALAEPSHGDISTVQRALTHHGLSRFLLAISNIEGPSGREQVLLHSFLFSRGETQEFARCGWVELQGKSPIRQAIESEEATVSIEPRSKNGFYRLGAETRLEDMPINPRAAPELHPDSWFKTPEGTERLREIKAGMERQIGPVRIMLQEGRIALAFTYHRKSYEIVFPESFPHSEPTIYRQGPEEEILTRMRSGEAWQGEKSDTCSYILGTLEKGSSERHMGMEEM